MAKNTKGNAAAGYFNSAFDEFERTQTEEFAGISKNASLNANETERTEVDPNQRESVLLDQVKVNTDANQDKRSVEENNSVVENIEIKKNTSIEFKEERKTRRAQLLFQPNLYEQILASAEAHDISVNEWIHKAARLLLQNEDLLPKKSEL